MIKRKREMLKRTSIGILAMLLITGCNEEKTTERVLPILGERDVEYKMIDGEEVADTIYHVVPSFMYLNQDSVMVSSEDLKGKIWVADFFFSHCPTICPPMTSQMKRLNEETQDLKDHIQFMSFSIDPERDTPKRLREYMDIYHISTDNWAFFTGEEEATHMLAKDFFNGAERDPEADGGFGHTDYFAIVDTSGYVRGIYQGTNADKVDELQEDLRKLLKHEYGIDGKQ